MSAEGSDAARSAGSAAASAKLAPDSRPKLVVVIGPTGSGKSQMAIDLAVEVQRSGLAHAGMCTGSMCDGARGLAGDAAGA